MEKFIKGLLAFCVLVCLAFGNVPILADAPDYTSTLSDYVRTFSESTDVGSYLDVLGSAADGDFQSLYDDGGNMVLKLGGTENDVPAKNENSGGKVWSSTESAERIALQFKVKCESRNMGGFCVYSLENNKMGVLFMMKGDSKKIYFLGKEIAPYDADTWYDVDLKTDFSVGYACLSVKKQTDNEWLTVRSAAFETSNPYLGSWIPVPSDVKSISFSHFRNTAKDRAVTYVDDLVVNTWSNEDGAVDFMQEDFSSAPITESASANEMVDSTSKWLLDDGELTQSNGVGALSADSDSDALIFKKPFYSAPSAWQRIRFKIGMPYNGGEMTAFASYNNPAASSTQTALASAKRMPIVKISADKITLGGTVHNISLASGILYDCEIVYSAKDKIAKVALEDADGTQYVGNGADILTAAFGTDADWGYLSEFGLSLSATTDSASSVAFDDFDWDLGVSSYCTSTLEQEQSSLAAPLDATVIFVFGETVDSVQTIGGISAEDNGSAVLKLFKDGESVDTPYTLEWVSGGTLKCTFDGLSANASYSVSIEGVTLLSGKTTDSEVLTFTTTPSEVTVGEPVFSDGTLSVDASTAYASGKTLMLIALKYDSTGKLIGVQILEEKVGHDVETLTISNISGCDKIGVVVWDNFINQKPYIELKMFDV